MSIVFECHINHQNGTNMRKEKNPEKITPNQKNVRKKRTLRKIV